MPRLRNSADLRERVTFSSPTTTDLGGGVATSSYSAVATVPARVKALRGDEVQARGMERATEAYEIVVRRPLPLDAEPSASWRVLWAGRVYDVEAIDRTDRRYYALSVSGPVVGGA